VLKNLFCKGFNRKENKASISRRLVIGCIGFPPQGTRALKAPAAAPERQGLRDQRSLWKGLVHMSMRRRREAVLGAATWQKCNGGERRAKPL
jgi:hypothetical protein